MSFKGTSISIDPTNRKDFWVVSSCLLGSSARARSSVGLEVTVGVAVVDPSFMTYSREGAAPEAGAFVIRDALGVFSVVVGVLDELLAASDVAFVTLGFIRDTTPLFGVICETAGKGDAIENPVFSPGIAGRGILLPDGVRGREGACLVSISILSTSTTISRYWEDDALGFGGRGVCGRGVNGEVGMEASELSHVA